ncbi:hypothetical protein UlMin_038215 [Ulmus minor]
MVHRTQASSSCKACLRPRMAMLVRLYGSPLAMSSSASPSSLFFFLFFFPFLLSSFLFLLSLSFCVGWSLAIGLAGFGHRTCGIQLWWLLGGEELVSLRWRGGVGREAQKSCLLVNAPLICRAASRVTFFVLKYAMTLDGKIAASSGHAAWTSSKNSRSRVFELQGRSDDVVVGGNTARRDTNLWDMSEASTIVVTQRGARRSFQKHLTSKGIEVVEFDILNPRDVMEYFHDRGYLSVLWECGGTLAASAISTGIIHKVFAFVAPKIIGGKNAPSSIGELGMVEMSQALDLIDVCYELVGPDMLISGFLQPIPDLTPVIPSVKENYAIDPTMPDENGNYVTWLSVEHYYQAQKFFGVNDPVVRDCVLKIKSAKSPEEAAWIGRSMQGQHPDLKRKILVYDKEFVSFFGLFQGINDSWNIIFDPKFGSNDSLGFTNYLLLLLLSL